MFSSVSGRTTPAVGPSVLANGASFSLPDPSLPMDLSFKLGVYPSNPSDVSVYKHKLGVPCGRVSSRDPRLFRRTMTDVAPLPPVSGKMPEPEHVQVFSDLMRQVAAAPLPSSDEEEEVVSPRTGAASSSMQVVSPSRQTEVAPTDTQDKTEVNPASVALPSSDSESGSEYSSDSDDDKECTSSSSGSTCNSSSCSRCNGSDSSSDSDSDNSSDNSFRSSSDRSSSSSSEDENSSSEEDDVSDHSTEEVDHSPSLDHKSGPSAETSPCSSGSPASSAYGSSSGSSSGSRSGSSSGSSSGSAASPSCSSGYGSATPGTSSSVALDPDFEKRLTIIRYGPQARGLRVWYNEDESDDYSSDSDDEPVLPPPPAPIPYTGKGKGKSTKRRKVDDLCEPFSRLSIGPSRRPRSVAPRRLLRCFGKLDITEPHTPMVPTKRKACIEEDSDDEHESRKKRRAVRKAEQRRYVELVREIFGADSDDETPVETPRKRRHVCRRRKAASASETAPAPAESKKVKCKIIHIMNIIRN